MTDMVSPFSAPSSVDRDRRNRPHQRPGDDLDDLCDGSAAAAVEEVVVVVRWW